MNAPRPLRPAEHLPYYLSFCGKRREMLVALNAWLADNPDRSPKHGQISHA